MNLPTFCIKRPVFATVVSLLLIVFGIASYQHLKTRFFPNFISNTVSISTYYPGASPSLVENSVTTPLEKSISGINGIDTISSVSAQGNSIIKVKINPGVNLYDITNKIRNKVSLASETLPANLHSPMVQMGHDDMDLIDIGFSIKNGKLQSLRDYLDRYVINRISQLPGISTVQVFGANKYAINIHLNPEKMAARHLSINDVKAAIQNSNIQLPAGTIKTQSMDIPVTAKTGLHSANEFANITIANIKGKLVYLKDIATVKLGTDTHAKSIVRINGQRAILLSVFNASDANPIDASMRVRQLLNAIKTQLPSNMHAVITFDQATYMRASIKEVYQTIFIAICFVALIIFLSLGKLRSTLIPITTIPICILATMGFMYLFGFSINIITLLAIVLSIGLVVDDAIVVLENVERHIESGLNRLQAAITGTKEITTPVIAMTLTLAAVYAPIGLIKGSISHIFAAFAFTLAAAVTVSGFVALTLSPMMCSKLLPDNINKTKPNKKSFLENIYQRINYAYQYALKYLLQHRLWVILLTITLAVGGFFSLGSLPKTFMPKEDMGFLVSILNTSKGSNNESAEKKLKILDGIIHDQSDIQTTTVISSNEASADSDGDNMIFTTLKPFEKRSNSANTLAKNINKVSLKQPGLDAATFAPSFGGSMHQQLAFYIMAPESYKTLYHTANQLIEKLSHIKALNNIHSNLQFDSQQYQVTVNRPLAASLQVQINTIDSTLATLLGGSTVTTFNKGGEAYDVNLQAKSNFLSSINAIKQFQVMSKTNQLVPLGNLIDIQPVLTQPTLFHYNRLRAAKITSELNAGYKLSTVVHDLQKRLPQVLPNNTKYAFTGQARRIVKSNNSMTAIFLLAFVFIYLVLSAQFESFLDPFIILLAVPFSIIGAVLGLKLIGGSINIYTLIGLVTLVGLIAKHGILITQFANTLHKQGLDTKSALIEAASIRLRPILMTTAAMTCGALPLMLATGASANSRAQIGVVIVAGLLLGTFFSLILVPIAYSYMSQFKQYLGHIFEKLER